MVNTIKQLFSNGYLFHILLSIIVSVLLTITILPLLKSGIPLTHDGEGHVARAANYSLALQQGQFPPRWAPNFWNGFGYPVLNFYYPLLSILSSPLILMGLHPEVAVKFWLILGLISLTINFILIGKKIAGTSAGLFASITILLSHYFFNLLYVRGAYGEFFAYVCLSFLLLSSVSLHSTKSKQLQHFWLCSIWLSTLALSISHNLMAAFLITSYGGLLVFFVFNKKLPLSAITAFILGLSASSFFWIPTLAELQFTVFDDVYTIATDHLATISQVLFDTVRQGVSHKSTEDELSLGIGPLSLLTLIYTTWSILTKPKVYKIPLTALVISSWLILFLVVEQSYVIWRTLLFLHILQFPWRLLGPVTLLIALQSILIYAHLLKRFKIIALILIIILTQQRLSWDLNDPFHFPKNFYINYLPTSTYQDELRTKVWNIPIWKLSEQRPLVSNNTTVDIKNWNGSSREYVVSSPEKTTIVEPTMYFPGWEVSVDDRLVQVFPEIDSGQITFTLPAGTHLVKTRFTQNTPARIIGNSISIITLCFSYILMKKVSLGSLKQKM